ncbi:DNRLRE domain-containing protein [Terriglobus saanensis]|uniref:DNRLRE domain-containing protein n=1 Tax=Terriglobus saanensis TaxID=870903 RepID=UPI0002D993E2|nr:DNRLRE domain-containing protein [Terriglobus saanensis]
MSLIGCALRGVAQQATLIADAEVTSVHSTTNYGALSNLYVGGGATSLLQFDLGALPSGTGAAQIARATLRLYANRVDVAGTITVQAVSGMWTESDVTFASIPSLNSVVESFPVAQPEQFVTADVTALVQQWVAAPAKNFGLALSAGSASAVFDSKENDDTAHPAVLEIALVNSGATGPKGDQGATGAQGPQGIQGPRGLDGQQGLMGPQGLTGAPGASGPVGVQGPAGPMGLQGGKGDAGAKFRGAYDSAQNYAVNDVVTWLNSAWISTVDSNHGNTPSFSPSQWAVLVPAAVGEQGVPGATGPQGLQGPQGFRGETGATGLQGPQGLTGATGRPGFVYQGTYQSTTNYTAGDVVLWEGESWASLTEANHGNTPNLSPEFWGMLTSTGPQGVPGVAGATGPQGPQGIQGQFGAQGERGLPGQTGPPGAQGPQGIPGAEGALGATGAKGDRGEPGPVGLTWRGAYVSGTNYALNDAVAWQGQSWLSIAASNAGNPPDASPLWWTLLAAQGAQGQVGEIGAVGPQGPRGLQGEAGLTGLTGPQGLTGSQGEAGARFIGTYDATVNYALHDVVTFGGSSWISLFASNQGNTPGASGATQWSLMAAKGDAGVAGPQGLQGVAGAIGAVGATGPQGVRGDPGPQGIAGPTGATGATGQQGPQGAKGDAGATGAVGARGLQWMGTYVSGTNYALGDAVALDGSSYVSLVDGNVGNTPGFSGVTQWALLSAKGDVGAAGTAGVNGLNGSNGTAATVQVGSVNTGAAGTPVSVQNMGTASAAVLNFAIPQGARGATGDAGLNYKGAWNAATGYALHDAVSFGGSSYLAVAANSETNPADDVAAGGSNWAVLAQQGTPGEAGAATVQIGSVTSGAAASVTNSGTQNAAVLNFTLPAGPAGSAGATGAVGMTYRGAWSGANQYSASDAVTLNGTSYLALTSNTNVNPASDVSASAGHWAVLAAEGTSGATGDVGPAGPSGSAATVSIGSVTTGTAAVTNSGTSSAAVLNFVLPAGGGASAGGAAYSSIHTVTGGVGANVFYSPMADLKASTETSTVLGYLGQACTVNAVDIYNSATTSASVDIRTGTAPGAMALASGVTTCTALAGKTTACPGPGALPAGSFIDLKIVPGTSTSTFVWSSFVCQ